MAFTRDDMAAYEQQTQEMVEVSPGTVEVAADPKPVEETPATEEATPATEGADADDTAEGGSSADDVEGDPATPSGEQGAETDLNAPPKGSARARIMELVDQRDSYKKFGTIAEQEIARLREENAALKGTKPATAAAPTEETPAAETTTSADDKPPSPDDPDVQYDPVKLQEKNAKWIKAQIDKGVEAGVARALTTKDTQTAQTAAREAFDKRVEAFEKTPEGKDFRKRVANPELPQLAPVARVLIGRAADGPALLNVLASDVALAKEVAALPPEDQVMRIGEIRAELKLKAKAAPAETSTTPAPGTKPVVKPKTVSSAPPPPTRVPSGSSPSTVKSLTDPSLSMEEFVKRDREEQAAARKAKRDARLGHR